MGWVACIDRARGVRAGSTRTHSRAARCRTCIRPTRKEARTTGPILTPSASRVTAPPPRVERQGKGIYTTPPIQPRRPFPFSHLTTIANTSHQPPTTRRGDHYVPLALANELDSARRKGATRHRITADSSGKKTRNETAAADSWEQSEYTPLSQLAFPQRKKNRTRPTQSNSSQSPLCIASQRWVRSIDPATRRIQWKKGEKYSSQS
jgi:hypothetical protein